MIPIWITVVTSLMSGLIGALIAQLAISRRELRRFQVDTLKRFAANRYDLKGEEFTRALNEIFIVFNEVSDVMKCLSEFHKVIVSRQPDAIANDALIKLFKAMCRGTSINYEQFNDAFFLTPFNVKATSTGQPN